MMVKQPMHDTVSLQTHIDRVSEKAKGIFARTDSPVIIVSPYRMNPLGAHIDHQGGSVLARTIDQYTLLALYPSDSPRVELHFDSGDGRNENDEHLKSANFEIGGPVDGDNWVRYAKASANCFASETSALNGFSAVVFGTLVSAGLSSSASVILAYLTGLAHVNRVQLNEVDMVELSRQVENEHMGLNNGLQDQMSIVFGRDNAISLLDMDTVSATYIANPPDIEEVSWVVCYSGFSRELVSSGFNDRVRECREAASTLDVNARHLGEVSATLRSEQHLSRLPEHLGLRARHVYSEMQRVSDGCKAWQAGDWKDFGDLMNQSCHSSINQYECGSAAMIELHRIALQHPAVYGSRFGGGGYGGCLMMLVQSAHTENVQTSVLNSFIEQFPEKKAIARTFVAQAESCVRVVQS